MLFLITYGRSFTHHRLSLNSRRLGRDGMMPRRGTLDDAATIEEENERHRTDGADGGERQSVSQTGNA